MPNKTVGIKYIESLYVIQKRRKFNISAIAITTDDRKISSSIYATKSDIEKLYLSYNTHKNDKEIKTVLSSGAFNLLKYYIPSQEDGMVPMYDIEIGDFRCKALPSAYEGFVYTLIDAYENASNKPTFSIRALPSLKKKKKKGIFE